MLKRQLLRETQPVRNYLILRIITGVVAFLLAWLPTAINRGYTALSGNTNTFLASLQLATSPSQGMIYYLVFFITWYFSPDLDNLPRTFDESEKDVQESDDESEEEIFSFEDGQMTTMEALEAGRITDEQYRKILNDIKFDKVTEFNTALNAKSETDPTIVHVL
jgi:hypothetical protein